MATGGFLVVIIGLAVTFVIGLVIVLLVALPGLRRDGRFGAHENDRFRLPQAWTGYESEVHGYFGDDETASLATREQAAVTAMREHSYALRPQPARHAAPPWSSLRPRTRHWKEPESGTGLRTSMGLLFGRSSG